jgi:hypothetical protein
MADRDSSQASLLPHPEFPGEAVQRIAASAELAGPDLLRFRYLLEADLRRLRVPPPVAGADRADRLWAHTCFEAFVGFARSPGYLELNFSPSGEWAAYRFDAYRQGMRAALDAAARLALSRSGDRLELQAEVRAGGILAPEPPTLRVGLSTVVEDLEGRLSYWALRHPPGRPDFHHPDSFSLVLELPTPPNQTP